MRDRVKQIWDEDAAAVVGDAAFSMPPHLMGPPIAPERISRGHEPLVIM